MKNHHQEKQQQQDQLQNQFSIELANNLKLLTTYHENTFTNLTIMHLKIPLEIEARKIRVQREKDLKGQKLLILVLNNHVKAIVDMKNMLQSNENTNQNIKRFSHKKINLSMYQQLGNQFLDNDYKLHHYISINHDLIKAENILDLTIKNYTQKNYPLRNNKIVQSRVRLMDLLLAVLRNREGIPKHQADIPIIFDRREGPPFKQFQASYIQIIVEELDQKVYELSTICEQVPQLEVFKRTLDLTMPEHNAYLTKIVKVLMDLHNKSNKFVQGKSQKIVQQRQLVEHECKLIEAATSNFVHAVQSQQQFNISPIYFNKRQNKTPEYFHNLENNITKITEMMVNIMAVSQQQSATIYQIKSMIEIFHNLLIGMQGYHRQWQLYTNKKNKNDDQEQIVQMLNLCLSHVQDKIHELHEEFFAQKKNIIESSNHNIQFLEESISKISKENQEQRMVIEELERQNQSLRDNLKNYQQRYRNGYKKNDQSVDMHSKLKAWEKKQGQYKNKISQLQYTNEEKQLLIINITNDLQQLTKQSHQLRQQLTQKNDNIDHLTQKYQTETQNLNSQIQHYKQQLHTFTQQKIPQLQTSTLLSTKKLQQSATTISQLKIQIQHLKEYHQNEKAQYKQQIIQLQTKIKMEMIQSCDQINKKQEQIDQLNIKNKQISMQLNVLMNKIQIQLKNKSNRQQQITKNIKQNQIKAQQQTNTYLAEIQRYKNDLIPSLQLRLTTQEQILTTLQNTIDELQQKQNSTINLEKNYVNLRKYANQLDEENRTKDEELKHRKKQYEKSLAKKNAKIKQLQLNMNHLVKQLNRMQQLQKSLSETHQDATKITDLQAKITDYDQQLKQISETLHLANLNKKYSQQQVIELEQEIENLRKKQKQAEQYQQQLQNTKIKLNQIGDLQYQLTTARNEISTLKNIQFDHTTKIHYIQTTLHTKNQIISQLETTIQVLKNQRTNIQNILTLKDQQLGTIKYYMEQQQQKIVQQLQKQGEFRFTKQNKQLLYMKQRIRTLENLIDVFSQQHGILQSKIKQYRLRQKSASITRTTSNKYQKLLQAYNSLCLQLKQQELCFQNLKNCEYQKFVHQSPVQKLDEVELRQKIIQLEKQNHQLKQQLVLEKIRSDTDQKSLTILQRTFSEEIIQGRQQNENGRQQHNNKQYDNRSYNRTESQKLQGLIRKMQNQTWNLNSKLDKIIQCCQKMEKTSEISSHSDFKILMQQIKYLEDQTRKLIEDKQQMSKVMFRYSNQDCFTEYVFRMIVHFAQIETSSPEAKSIWEKLEALRRQNSGPRYFIILEEFMKFTLQESAIQVYRRELKEKIKEQEQRKSKVNTIIEEVSSGGKKIYEKSVLTAEKVLKFREKMAHSANSNPSTQK